MSVIVSYNINGIRAAIRKGLDLWITDLNADVICFQEIKANKEQFNIDLFNSLGYYSFVFQLISQDIVVLQLFQRLNQIMLNMVVE